MSCTVVLNNTTKPCKCLFISSRHGADNERRTLTLYIKKNQQAIAIFQDVLDFHNLCCCRGGGRVVFNVCSNSRRIIIYFYMTSDVIV